MGAQDEMDQYTCIGCGEMAESTIKIATPFQRFNECGWWVAPPPGWLMLVDADLSRGSGGPLWVCSVGCAEAFDQARAEDLLRRRAREG